MNAIKYALSKKSLQFLFNEQIGWDRIHVYPLRYSADSSVSAISQKRGFMAFACEVRRTELAKQGLLRWRQRELRKHYHEHILIHDCETP